MYLNDRRKREEIMDNPRVQWLTRQVRGNKILDIGFAGKEADAIRLHRSFKRKNKKAFIVGVDLNQDLLLKFREENTLVGDTFALPFKNESFDGVVLGEVIEHFFDITGLIREVSRVLEPGGKLYLTTPSSYALFRWVKYWLLSGPKKVATLKNARSFLGDQDHKVIWEPLSLVNLLAVNRLKTIQMTTKTLGFPYIGFLREQDISWWPFNRFEEQICLIAKKQ